MKHCRLLLKIARVSIMMYGSRALAQNPDPDMCWTQGMVIQNGALPSQTQVIRGGREITTQGTLLGLVVFVRFADDAYNQPLWPDYTKLPSWASSIVDLQIPPSNVYTQMNMSDFFDRASGGDGNGNLGAFRVIGDVYYVVTDNGRSFYNEDAQAVNEHVLRKLDATVDYSLYDNWTFMKNGQLYNHENTPDDKVDYIWIIWRGRSPYSLGNLGEKNLNADVILDGKLITYSSGSTHFRYSYFDPTNGDMSIGGPYDQKPGSILVPSHEFTHYIFGGNNTTGHIDGRTVYGGIPNVGNVLFFAFMTSNSNGTFSAYERYRAGWLNPDIIETDMSSVQLMDTHKKNKAVMIPIRRDGNNEIREYFMLENFHTRNDYAGANPFTRRQIFDHVLRNGILVFHVEDEDLSLPTNSNLDIECADGLWQWSLSAGQSTPCDKCDDWIFHNIPSPNLSASNVFDERDQVFIQVGPCLNDYLPVTPGSVGGGPPDCRRRYTRDALLGDNEDFFRESETDVFSRWSNPSTSRADLAVTDRAFEVAAYNPSTKEYTLKVMVTYNGALGLKPSKPQDLRVTVSGSPPDDHPKLTWRRNLEPDAAAAPYRIWRKITGDPSWDWTLIATVSDTTFTDNNIGIGRKKYYSIQYKIKAVDTQGMESVFSDPVSISAQYLLWKVGLVENIEEKPESFYLSQNAPNPFNPSTTIFYTLPEESNVSIKLYDVLGREIMLLVDEVKEAGYHEVTVNASQLASGIYLYRLQAGSFTNVKRMLLLK